jgi:hypothetical protein
MCILAFLLIVAPAAALTTSLNRLPVPPTRWAQQSAEGARGMSMKIFDWKKRTAGGDCECRVGDQALDE